MWSQFIVDWQNGNCTDYSLPHAESETRNIKDENEKLKEQINENTELDMKISNAKHVKTKVLTKSKKVA